MDLRLVCAFLLLEQKPAAAAAAALCWIYWDVLLFCEHCCNHSRCGVLSLSLSLSPVTKMILATSKLYCRVV
jgi:hypothetical protein